MSRVTQFLVLLASRQSSRLATRGPIRHAAAFSVAAQHHVNKRTLYSPLSSRQSSQLLCPYNNARWFSSAPVQEDELNVYYPGLVERIESGDIQLIDVREPEELVQWGQITNSYNIPLGQVGEALKLDEADFQAKYGRPKPSKGDRNIVFHCRAGVRSLEALQTARMEGFQISNQYAQKTEHEPLTSEVPRLLAELLGQVQEAFRLPEDKFEARYGHPKPSETDNNIVFHCRSGKRSLTALEAARKEGFTLARHFPGGWLEWAKENNLPGE